MKRFFVFLISITLLGALFCGCGRNTTETSSNPDQVGPYVFIRQASNSNAYLVYNVDTNVVYVINHEGFDNETCVPYYLYENGAIYGAVYKDGEIIPAPFAIGLTDEMIKEYLNGLF